MSRRILSSSVTSCPLMLHLALGCGTAVKGTVMLISWPAMMVMSLRLRSLVIFGGHLAGEIVDHAVAALSPPSTHHLFLDVVAKDWRASIMPWSCPLNGDRVRSGSKVSWLSRSTWRVERMLGCDRLLSLCRIRNTVLVLGVDLEVVLLAHDQVPHPCVAGGDVAAHLGPLLLANFTLLHDIIGDGRSTIVMGSRPVQVEGLSSKVRCVDLPWRSGTIQNDDIEGCRVIA